MEFTTKTMGARLLRSGSESLPRGPKAASSLRRLMAVKNRSPDRGGRPLTFTYRSPGIEVPVWDVQRPVARRPRAPAPDPQLPLAAMTWVPAMQRRTKPLSR